MHDTPRYIECKGHQLQNEICMGIGLSYDLFDICMHRPQQLDRLIYKEHIALRWRNFLVRTKALEQCYEIPILNILH